MTISRQLPLILLDSFYRQFESSPRSYRVLFEGKTQSEHSGITIWIATIEHHPDQGPVKYFLIQDGKGKWQKTMGINILELGEESSFLTWAVDHVIAQRQEEYGKPT